jgi:hypothetical protein
VTTDFEVWAWIGEDEFGSGVVGLKQGDVPAGRVPLVSTERSKIDQPYLRAQLQAQADRYGKTIRLVHLVLINEVDALEPSEPR